MKKIIIIFIGVFLITYAVSMRFGNFITKESHTINQQEIDSLFIVCNKCLQTLAKYEKEIRFKDSLLKELLPMVYSSGYMKGVIDYKLFKEYLDTVRKYEVDTTLIEP